jgi:hypothetical protein
MVAADYRRRYHWELEVEFNHIGDQILSLSRLRA